MQGSSAIKYPETTHTAGITKIKRDIFNMVNRKKMENKNIERFVMAPRVYQTNLNIGDDLPGRTHLP